MARGHARNSTRGDVPDGLFEAPEVDGFREMDGEAGRASLLDVGGGAETGKGYGRDGVGRAAQAPQELETAAVGELDVADDDIELGLQGDLYCRRHIGGPANFDIRAATAGFWKDTRGCL